MPKLTLPTITAKYASTDALNSAFAAIEDNANNTISRDGTSPNEMEANLDMNGHNILNASSMSVESLTINGELVVPTDLAITSLPAQATHAGKFLQTDGTGASWQGVQDEDVEFIQSGAGASTRTVEAKLRDVVNIEDYGPAGDGVTDDAAVVNTVVGAGRAVEVPDKTYLIKQNNSLPLVTTAAETSLRGTGAESILDLQEESAAGTSEWFTMGGAGFLLEKLKLKFSKALVGVSTAIMVKTRYSRIALRRLLIDGQTTLVAGTQDRSVQLVKSESTATTDSVDVIECDVTGVARAYTRDNTDSSAQKIVKVALNKFRQMWRTVLTFNAPSGSIEDVLVVGNTFDVHAGVVQADSGLSGNHNAVGFVGVLGGRVIGNHVSGAYGALVHVEENTDGAAIIGNTARMANASAADGAMETLANNIGGATVTPTHLAHVGNVLRSTDGVGNGFHIQSSLSSDGARWSHYVGNVSAGFDDAFKSATDLRSVLVADNVLRGVTSALDLTRASLLVRGNVLEDCPVPINVARGGLMGLVHYVDLSAVTGAVTTFGASASGPLSLTEWTWESDLFTTVNGAQNINIGPMPTRIFGTFTIAITVSTTEHRLMVVETSYDGATVTNTTKLSYGSGDVTITGPANNAGQFAIAISDATGPTGSVRMQVRFHGGAFVI